MNEETYLGCLKYDGDLVTSGIMDARKSAQALLGLDQALRYFSAQQRGDLQGLDYELPVRIRKGSWEISIPETITLITAGTTIIGTAYASSAASTIAKNDFGDVSMKDILRKSLRAIKWVIKIGKHIGDLSIKTFEKVEFKENNELIGIQNAVGQILYVPKIYLDYYCKMNPNLLAKVCELVESGRDLLIGCEDEGGEYTEESVTTKHKRIFTRNKDDNETLFPELAHGMEVTLEGELTRGNEVANSLGFGYNAHILLMRPASGSIVRYKHALFSRCRIHGTISRIDTNGKLRARKPMIILNDLEVIDSEPNQLLDFQDEE